MSALDINCKGNINQQLVLKKNILTLKSKLICDKCKLKFDNISDYYFHRSVHINSTGIYSWLCAQCNKDFNKQSDLLTHELELHGEIRPYACPHCVHSFTKKFLLDNHIRRLHYNEKHYKCKFCSQRFYRTYDLKIHSNLHLGIKLLCHICGKSFSHPSNLYRHQRIHTGIKPYVCKICKVRFTHISSLKAHNSSHATGKMCHYCNAVCQTTLGLKKHFEQIHKIKILNNESVNILQGKNVISTRYYYCNLCGESYRFKKELQLHKKNEHLANTLKLVPKDKNYFINNNISGFHNKIKNMTKSTTLDGLTNDSPNISMSLEPIDEVEFIEIILNADDIESCNQNQMKKIIASNKIEAKRDVKNIIFIKRERKYNISNVKKDVANIYPINIENKSLKDVVINEKLEYSKISKNFICQYCQKTFTKKWNFNQHLGIHDASLRKYYCSKCDISFSYRSTFTTHLQCHDNPDKIFKCSQCTKKYKTYNSRLQHIKKFHSKICNYSCSVCDKSFFDKSVYNYHMRIHNQEYPYICSSCGRKFSHVSHLYRHEKIHTGEKPHKCELCGSSFIQLASLKIHLRKHKQYQDKEHLPKSTNENYSSTNNTGITEVIKNQTFNELWNFEI